MEEPWPYTNDMDLKVINASILRSGSSRYFLMDSQPRGRAIVFVATDGLMDEADRWSSIFKQLGFQYDVYRDATCIQIRDVLEVIRDKPFDANALFVMFIGGGYNENICGYAMDSWRNPTESITLFGQAFSYTIAQQEND
ncbi:unnamed protein product [Oppiella nova]|uniref:Uncharacterized protein n=1 Tax=Oppiella nova TaxID=334625 RepID=A0A7R9QNH7_9ACAR|nr:unnamed protein product [Oppiella nova]CAG2168514.1 unnamed protein product [Oppiella nova]